MSIRTLGDPESTTWTLKSIITTLVLLFRHFNLLRCVYFLREPYRGICDVLDPFTVDSDNTKINNCSHSRRRSRGSMGLDILGPPRFRSSEDVDLLYLLRVFVV